jgi:hypothetical protein
MGRRGWGMFFTDKTKKKQNKRSEFQKGGDYVKTLKRTLNK